MQNIKKTILLIICTLSLQPTWGQWTSVTTDNFNAFPAGFLASGFSNQPGGAETGGQDDFCAYVKKVGTNPTTLYVSKLQFLEGGYIYRFSYYAKRQNVGCGITFKHSLSAGTGGTIISDEFFPPQRADGEAGDNFVSNEITGTGNSQYLKVVVTTGVPVSTNNTRLRIDGFELERMPALPIKLVSFTASSHNNTTLLHWQTASEFNNQFMAIERSENGRDFSEIGRIDGTGTTNETKNYQFVDKNPLFGLNYYRLRQVDFDGHFQYHNIISVHVNKNSKDIQIIPTSASDEIRVYYPKINHAKASLHIFDHTGQHWKTINLIKESRQAKIDIHQLPKGLYILQIIDEKNTASLQFNKT